MSHIKPLTYLFIQALQLSLLLVDCFCTGVFYLFQSFGELVESLAEERNELDDLNE